MTRRTIFPVLLLGALLGASAPTSASSDGPGSVVDRFFDAYRSGQVAAMMELYSPDARFVDVAQRHEFRGSDELRDFLTQLTAVHTEMDIHEQRRVVAGNVVVVDYLYTGELSGEALREITGKTTCQDTVYSIPVTTWFEVEGDRIVEQKDFIDLATLQMVRERASGTTTGAHDQ